MQVFLVFDCRSSFVCDQESDNELLKLGTQQKSLRLPIFSLTSFTCDQESHNGLLKLGTQQKLREDFNLSPRSP